VESLVAGSTCDAKEHKQHQRKVTVVPSVRQSRKRGDLEKGYEVFTNKRQLYYMQS